MTEVGIWKLAHRPGRQTLAVVPNDIEGWRAKEARTVVEAAPVADELADIYALIKAGDEPDELPGLRHDPDCTICAAKARLAALLSLIAPNPGEQA